MDFGIRRIQQEYLTINIIKYQRFKNLTKNKVSKNWTVSVKKLDSLNIFQNKTISQKLILYKKTLFQKRFS